MFRYLREPQLPVLGTNRTFPPLRPVLGGSALSQAAKGGQKEPSEGIIYNRG